MISVQVWPVGPTAGSGGVRTGGAGLPSSQGCLHLRSGATDLRKPAASPETADTLRQDVTETRTAVSGAQADARGFEEFDLRVRSRRLLSTGLEKIDGTHHRALSLQGALPERNRSLFQGSGAACQGALERAAGIEPASLAWKAKVLPLHNARVRDGNYSGASTSSRTDVRGTLA